jgi:hypothetical protein
MKSGATLSPCRRYRYVLWRQWDERLPAVVFCGLNPSTADETADDATIRRELGFARAWGFGKLVKVNAYGWRATDPRQMLAASDPTGEENLATVLHEARRAALFVAAWGNRIREVDAFVLRTLLRQSDVRIHVLRLTKAGNPSHPLYLPRDLWPVTWPGAERWRPSTETRETA